MNILGMEVGGFWYNIVIGGGLLFGLFCYIVAIRVKKEDEGSSDGSDTKTSEVP